MIAEQFPAPYPTSGADYIDDITDAETATLEVWQRILGFIGDECHDTEAATRSRSKTIGEAELLAALDRQRVEIEGNVQALAHQLGRDCGFWHCKACAWTSAKDKTKGMSPDDKALWILRHTNIRANPITDTVPSMSSGPDHHITTEFDGLRPVHRCDGCIAGQHGQRCWGLALWEKCLEMYAPKGEVAS